MKDKEKLREAISWLNYHSTNAVGALIVSKSDRTIEALEKEIDALDYAIEVLKQKYEEEP